MSGEGPQTQVKVCKQCGKEFQAAVSYYRNVHIGKDVKRVEQYCSKECYREYHRRMTAKAKRMGA